MKSWLALLCLLLSTLSARSQPAAVNITSRSVVRDSTGRQYAPAQWLAMIRKDHKVVPLDSQNVQSEWLLVKLEGAELQAKKAEEEQRAAKMPRPRELPAFVTGSELREFTSADINGNRICLKEARGKVVVLNFWYVSCGPCQLEIPDLNELVDSFGHTGKVVFYGIGLDDRSTIQSFLQRRRFAYTLIGNGRPIADSYGVRWYPTHVVLDTEGRVYFHTGGLEANTIYWIRKSIRELLEKG